MDIIQFRVIEERLKRIEELIKNIQPKPKKLRQSMIVDKINVQLEWEVDNYSNKYSPMMIKDFLLYWEEGDRWKKEKVFDVGKRLERWKRQQEKWDYERTQKQALKKVEERPIHRNEEVREDGGFNSIGNLLKTYK